MRSYLPIVVIKLLLMMIMIIVLSSCYAARQYHVASQPIQENRTNFAVTLSQVYFYPKANQTPEQMDRDRYQCYQWAMKQTGFDPNASSLPPKQRIAVVPAPAPGQEVAASAIIGAAIGAIAAGPRHALGGAAIGAGTGALVGAASASVKQESAKQMEESLNSQEEARYDRNVERKASAFRRAMSACLEGRGYSVQ